MSDRHVRDQLSLSSFWSLQEIQAEEVGMMRQKA